MDVDERILIFGTGQGAEKTLKTIENMGEIIGYIDNDRERQGAEFHGKLVYSPQEAMKLDYDKIVICSVAIDMIRKQMISMGFEPNVLMDKNYFHARRFLQKYDCMQYRNDAEIQEVIERVKKNGLKVFNYPFADEYMEYPVEVHWDCEKDLYYAVYYGKKMYMAKKYKKKEDVVDYIRALMREQDIHSPHRYITENFKIENGSVLIDAGVAEGNFALEHIDEVSKVYLIETDLDWIEALNYTFAPYKDKVTIVQGFLTDIVGDNTVTIDAIAKGEKIDFIKMDIEGAEVKALAGAKETLRKYKPKLDICSYHNEADEQKILSSLAPYDYQTEHSKGYMVFLVKETFQTTETKSLVRGLIRAQ